MNVYDFDETIYNGDSTVDFYFYCMKRNPRILLRLQSVLWGFFLYLINVYSKTQFKQNFYKFLKYVNNVDETVKSFWETHETNIKQFYKDNKKRGDLVISASPEFLLAPVCEKLGVTLIASRVNKHSGVYSGENCHGKEKVNRFNEKFEGAVIEKFYSDSVSDGPLAEMAGKAFMVQKERIIPWEETALSAKRNAVNTFLSRSFLCFVLIGGVNTFLCTLLSYVFSLWIDPNAAFACGYAISLVGSYFLNSFITFKSSPAWRKFVKFCLSYVPNYLLQQIIVTIGIGAFGINKLAAYIAAAVIGVPLTFVIMKIFAFKQK